MSSKINPKMIPVSSEPKLMKFWDSEKNALPSNLVSSKERVKKYWWKCQECGYSWEATPRARLMARVDDCPCCVGNIIAPGINDFLTAMPELKAWFHPEDNKDVDYTTLGITNYSVKLWWRCPECGFKFQSNIQSRIDPDSPKDKPTLRRCRKCYYKSRSQYSTIASEENTAKFWSTKLNGDLDPATISVHSKERVWWECQKCGYTWQAAPLAKKESDKCPHCESKHSVFSGKNDAATLVPELLRIFDEEAPENAGTDLKTLGIYAKKVVAWKCPDCGHKWTSTVDGRISKKEDGTLKFIGCPRCNENLVNPEKTSLKAKHPKIAKMWGKYNPTKPEKVFPDSSRRYFWTCPDCGREYSAPAEDMVSGKASCPYCNERRVIEEENSVKAVHPELAKLWSVANEMGPERIFASSKRRYFWTCPDCGRDYEATPFDMASGDADCPYCNKRIVIPEESSLKALYPKIAKLWSSQNTRGPETVFPSSRMIFIWNCAECGHTYKAEVADIVNNSYSCPYCEERRVDPLRTSLKAKYPEIAAMWSPLNERGPETVFPTATLRALWECPECKNSYWADVKDVVENNAECPYCTEKRVDPNRTSLAALHPEIAKTWSKQNNRGPETVFPNSSLKVVWDCPECGNSYSALVKDIVSGDDNCPYCNERRVIPNETSLKAKYPEIATMWSPLNEREPDAVFPTAAVRVLWDCPECGNSFSALVKDIVSGEDDCPYCNERRVIPDKTSLKAKYPKIAAMWSPLNERGPETVFPTATIRALWECPDCQNSYWANVKDVVENDAECPYCTEKRVDPNRTSLKALHPDIAEMWSSKNKRGAETVFPDSKIRVIWDCPYCGFEYEANVADVVTKDNACPYCNETKVMPGFNSFAAKHPDLMDEWLLRTNKYVLRVDPDQEGDKSRKVVWWRCKNNPDHRYSMAIADKLMYQHRERESCPYCKGRRRKLIHFVKRTPRPTT